MKKRSAPYDRVPTLTTNRLVFGFMIAAVLTLATEWGLRAFDVQPTISDSVGLWSVEADRIGDGAIVLVGSSRFQVALDAETISSRSESRVVNLSSIGRSPLPILTYLANRNERELHVVVEFMPTRFCTPDERDIGFADQLLVKSRRRSAISDLETNMRVAAQSRFAFLNGSVDTRAWVLGQIDRDDVLIATMKADRSMRRDHSSVDGASVEREKIAGWQTRYADPMTDAQWRERLQGLRRDVTAITDRGGTVTFFRINASGETLRFELEHPPLRGCWEKTKAELVGASFLHFRDMESIASFELPEGGHADASQRIAISEALSNRLKDSL